MIKHENNVLYDNKGVICNRVSNTVLGESVSVVIDRGVGTVLKLGTSDDMVSYYGVILNSGLFKGVELLTFEVGEFTASEVCTLVNYLRNSLPKEQVDALLSLSCDDLHSRLRDLEAVGF